MSRTGCGRWGSELDRSTARRLVDLLLLSVLLVLMAYPLTGNAVHEVLGLGLCAMLVGHNLLNFSWYRSRWNGNALVRLHAGINLLLLLSLATLLGSGALISRTVFPWAAQGEAWTARDLHVAAGCWLLLLSSVHLGIHWRRVVPPWTRDGGRRRRVLAVWARRIALVGLVAAGLTEFVTGNLMSRMFLRELFGDFVPGEPWWRFLLRHAAVIGAFAVLAAVLDGWLRRRSARKCTGNLGRIEDNGYDLDTRGDS